MPAGARSPEELETLLEDAVVLGDMAAAGRLFEVSAVLGTADGEAHGRAAIEGVAARLWASGYLADPQRVVVGRDLALILGAGAVHVARRHGHTWRYAVAVSPHSAR